MVNTVVRWQKRSLSSHVVYAVSSIKHARFFTSLSIVKRLFYASKMVLQNTNYELYYVFVERHRTDATVSTGELTLRALRITNPVSRAAIRYSPGRNTGVSNPISGHCAYSANVVQRRAIDSFSIAIQIFQWPNIIHSILINVGTILNHKHNSLSRKFNALEWTLPMSYCSSR